MDRIFVRTYNNEVGKVDIFKRTDSEVAYTLVSENLDKTQAEDKINELVIELEKDCDSVIRVADSLVGEIVVADYELAKDYMLEEDDELTVGECEELKYKSQDGDWKLEVYHKINSNGTEICQMTESEVLERIEY